MTIRLPRVIQKIFGMNADTDDAIAQFGSVIAGQPTFTGDIEEIQALNAWNNGWVGSTITNKRYPTSEETTGINKVVTQQLAYLLQRGIPEWSAEETYYTNSFCQADGTIYVSLTDNNIGNIPTASASAWRLYEVNNSVTRSVGELTISPIPLIEAGLHLLDGALLDGNGIYGEFVDYIARRYSDDNKIPNANLIGYIRQDDGILSNFSADGYAALPSTFSPDANTWEFVTKINITSIGADNSILASETNQYVSFYVNSQGYLTFNLGDGSAWISGDISGSTLLSIDTDYYVKLEFDGTKYTSYYSIDNEIWTQEASYTGSIGISNAALLLGINRNIQGPLSGTIDLNASYININNKRWWSGMRTSWIVDESVWQSSIVSYGVCGKFVYDPIANTVRLPKVTGIIEGTTDINALGDLVEAGLPASWLEHTHTRGTMNITGGFTGGANYEGGNQQWGAFVKYGETNNIDPGDGRSHKNCNYSFDASRSWSGSTSTPNYTDSGHNSSTVQPQTIKLMFYICVATATKTEIQVNIDEVATDLNMKADVNLTNVPTSKGILTESYVNGTSWYRVYSDGWIEQGGFIDIGSSRVTVTFLKPFINTTYNIQASISDGSPADYAEVACSWNDKTTSSVTFYFGFNGTASSTTSCDWRACGYIR